MNLKKLTNIIATGAALEMEAEHMNRKLLRIKKN